MIENYLFHIFILIGIYGILAFALQLSLGFTGMLNLGHIAFYAIGAYASALLSMQGFPFWLCLVLAGLIAMIFGFLLSYPVNKLKGDYFALASLSFLFVVYAVLLNWQQLTHGALGVAGIAKPVLFGIPFSDNFSFLLLTVIVAAISIFIIYRIVASPFGTALQAVRDDELAARTLGIDVGKMKRCALAASAFFAGIAGSLYAHYITYIDPSSFTLFQMIPVLTIVIIAGLASLRGTVIATILVVVLPELLRFLGFPSDILGPMRQIVFALILLLILLYKPTGLFGKVELG